MLKARRIQKETSSVPPFRECLAAEVKLKAAPCQLLNSTQKSSFSKSSGWALADGRWFLIRLFQVGER